MFCRWDPAQAAVTINHYTADRKTQRCEYVGGGSIVAVVVAVMCVYVCVCVCMCVYVCVGIWHVVWCGEKCEGESTRGAVCSFNAHRKTVRHTEVADIARGEAALSTMAFHAHVMRSAHLL